MTKTRRSYTEAFKIEAVRLYERSSKTQEDVEEELGIGKGCLSRWKKKYGEDADTQAIEEQEAQATQIRQLARENEILRQEREILKKQSPSSRNPSDEIQIHRGSSRRVPDRADVQCAERFTQWILCVARSATQPAGDGESCAVQADQGCLR